jgi:hypothetical protein
MNVKNMLIVGAVIVSAAAIVFVKQTKKAARPMAASAQAEVKGADPQGKALPRLVDLGANKWKELVFIK